MDVFGPAKIAASLLLAGLFYTGLSFLPHSYVVKMFTERRVAFDAGQDARGRAAAGTDRTAR